MKFGHIVNPVKINDPEKDLSWAQPVTFKSFENAVRFCPEEIDVSLYTAQFEEDCDIIPPFMNRTPNLTRSAIDLQKFNVDRKLPFLADILHRLFESFNGDYMIYTNVDIALMPHFYVSVEKSLRYENLDALVINRRTIPGHYRSPDDIALMYGELGESHAGWDCFVFRRSLFTQFDLGLGLIGQGWIGRILLANLLLHAEKMRILENSHFTFHIGNDKSWKTDRFRDYQEHNIRECKRFLIEYEQQNKALDRSEMPGNFFHLEPNVE